MVLRKPPAATRELCALVPPCGMRLLFQIFFSLRQPVAASKPSLALPSGGTHPRASSGTSGGRLR